MDQTRIVEDVGSPMQREYSYRVGLEFVHELPQMICF